MSTRPSLFIFVLVLIANVGAVHGQWTPEEREVVDAIDALSATTNPDGGGAEAYAALLADDYSRWAMGATELSDKESWVDGVAEWLEAGWQVVERNALNLEISVVDDVASVRRIVKETYLGPDGETSSSRTALSEIWVRREGEWRQWRVDGTPVEE